MDSSKARARLGWNRRLRLEDALDWTAEWYRAVHAGADAEAATLAQIERYEALADGVEPPRPVPAHRTTEGALP